MFAKKMWLMIKKLNCPCCGNTISEDKAHCLMKSISSLIETSPGWMNFFYGGDAELAFKRTTSGKNWACDDCLSNQKALIADPMKQEFLDWPPYYAYFDKINQCKTCKKEFCFSKHEQIFWYEELKFWVQSEAVNCKECRIAKRERKDEINNARKRLDLLLPKLDLNDEGSIEEVVQAYEDLGAHKKVVEYNFRLNKLRRKSHQDEHNK
jgi:Probable zinc-ribbon domain